METIETIETIETNETVPEIESLKIPSEVMQKISNLSLLTVSIQSALSVHSSRPRGTLSETKRFMNEDAKLEEALKWLAKRKFFFEDQEAHLVFNNFSVLKIRGGVFHEFEDNDEEE